MLISQLAQITEGNQIGKDVDFMGVGTDTRTLIPQQLFIAIPGQNFDGHHFIEQACAKHAAAALVQYPCSVDIPQVVVPDTIKALGKWASWHRQRFSLPVIAVTGSCGKTTVKTMIANILQFCGSTLFSESSFNNPIGLPLTVLKLTAEHQYAVLEMGTNHFGEIAYLTQIGKPTVAVINNAGPAHLEGLGGNVEGVSRAKGEIFQGLTKTGTAIINADDVYATYWESLVQSHRVYHFGIQNAAEISAKHIQISVEGKPSFVLVTPDGEIEVNLPLLGKHNVMNALASAACAMAVDAPLSAIKKGLETVPAVKCRLNEHQTQKGARIIDDTYNANPLSFQAAIEILAQQSGEKILVLGDMKELGQKASDYHRQLGEVAKRLGIHQIFAYGEYTQDVAIGFGENCHSFDDQAQLIQTLKQRLHANMTLLVKGSRSTQMDQVVSALITE